MTIVNISDKYYTVYKKTAPFEFSRYLWHGKVSRCKKILLLAYQNQIADKYVENFPSHLTHKTHYLVKLQCSLLG